MERIPTLETKEHLPPRNLRTYPEETIRAIAEIEGPGWMEIQQKIQEGKANPAQHPNSVPMALERLAQGERSVIYGAYGMNRWLIDTDGSVVFSKMHAASERSLAKARELGFEIE